MKPNYKLYKSVKEKTTLTMAMIKYSHILVAIKK